MTSRPGWSDAGGSAAGSTAIAPLIVTSPQVPASRPARPVRILGQGVALCMVSSASHAFAAERHPRRRWSSWVQGVIAPPAGLASTACGALKMIA